MGISFRRVRLGTLGFDDAQWGSLGLMGYGTEFAWFSNNGCILLDQRRGAES
jgi:hypothetical protein